MNLDTIFREVMPEKWPSYETRDAQLKMANLVSDSLVKGKIAMIEAGTGVGKSLAYLLPASIFSLESGSLVLISTETKALQDQIVTKDLPLVENLLNRKIKVSIALGASNYLCKRKLNKSLNQGELLFGESKDQEEFLNWEKTTDTGIRSEFKGSISNSNWSKVSREPDNCLGRFCPNFSISYYFLEKEKWKSSNILVVNHALLGAHLAGDSRLLPSFAHLVVDEAHSFPEIIGRSQAMEIEFETIADLLNFIYTEDKKSGLAINLPPKPKKLLISLIKKAQSRMLNFFNLLLQELPIQFQSNTRSKNPLILDSGDLEDALLEISEAMKPLVSEFSKEAQEIKTREIGIGLDMCSSRLSKIAVFLTKFREKSDLDWVFWIEPTNYQKRHPFYKILAQPKSTEAILNQMLYPNVESLVFTSATLTPAPGQFDYFEKEVGTKAAIKSILPSPFPYEKNCLLFVPSDLSDPVQSTDRHLVDVSFYVQRLLQLTEGRTFVLFTSNKALQKVYEEVSQKISYPIHSQLELGAVVAKERFLKEDNSILFGVSSFWQGIDIKGDQLKQVIITKLPFQVPTEPVLQAKMEELEKEGKNPFWELQIPRTFLTLRQGFGRLIRGSSDSGIVAILDPRIHTKSYGKQVLGALPPGIPRLQKFEELKAHYHNLPKY